MTIAASFDGRFFLDKSPLGGCIRASEYERKLKMSPTQKNISPETESIRKDQTHVSLGGSRGSP